MRGRGERVVVVAVVVVVVVVVSLGPLVYTEPESRTSPISPKGRSGNLGRFRGLVYIPGTLGESFGFSGNFAGGVDGKCVHAREPPDFYSASKGIRMGHTALVASWQENRVHIDATVYQ